MLICESAASLLFTNIQWARHVPAFVNLPVEDQVCRMEIYTTPWRGFKISTIQVFFILKAITKNVFSDRVKGAIF